MKKKMKDEVLEYIKNNLKYYDFSAQDIAMKFCIKRNVASHYLNQLFSDGKLLKNDSVRPVMFKYNQQKPKDCFSKFIGADISLKSTIDKCKATVMYPPNGLPLIIKGNSGVGKSFLASLIYQYALDRKVIHNDAKFVVVNCADYANNPELLSAVLFGYKKGAFTGAEKDTAGMLSSANGGYLFLDEVHNLSAENQEKLFLLMDSQKYRKLGESVQWEYANVRLILATTEDKNTSLLATFRRRIPAEITLPDYNNRSTSEKIQLLFEFLKDEAITIDSKIFCSIELFTDLLSKTFEGNVGELRNEIKLLCAEGYLGNKRKSSIYLGDKLDSGFWIDPEISIDLKKMFLKSLSEIDLIELFQNHISIEESMSQLRDRILKECAGSSEYNYLESDEFIALRNYVVNKISPIIDSTGLCLLDEFLADISLFIMFIDVIEETSRNFLLSKFRKFRMKNDKQKLLANEIWSSLEVEESKQELLLKWILFLVKKFYVKIPETHCLIVMHGKITASAIARETNKLLNTYVYEAFDMPIEGETSDLINLINNFCKSIDTTNGLILLVDMGSLEQMYEKIESNVIGDLVILNNVSTALAIECGIQVCQKKPISHFYQMDFDSFQVKVQYYKGLSQKKNVIVSCLSGEGISEKVKDILKRYLDNQVEILIFDFNALKKIAKEKDTMIFKNTICVLSTTEFYIQGIDCLNLENLINGNQTLEKLNKYMDSDSCEFCLNELVKLFTIEGASTKLRFLDSKKVFNEIEKVLYLYEKYYDVKIPSFLRINLFLHLSGMIERIMIGDGITNEHLKEGAQLFDTFLNVSKDFFSEIKDIYCIEIPKGEYE
ncbi:TPA: sigma 54-interacting transcriptional regulator, partial [Enterococcus faecium]